MKKSFILIFCIGSIAVNAQIFPEEIQKNLERYYKDHATAVQQRDSMPVLRIDTLYCRGNSIDQPNQLQSETFSGWTYDAQGQLTEYRSQMIFYPIDTLYFGWKNKTNYFYNADGCLYIEVAYEVSPQGQVYPVVKTEYEYNNFGQKKATYSFIWNSSSWLTTGRILYTYDAAGNQTEILRQNYLSNIWENASRNQFQFDNNNNLKSTVESQWVSGAWNNVSAYQASYDTDGNLIEEITYAYDGTTLYPVGKTQYFNVTSIPDSIYRFAWNVATEDWDLLDKEVRVYNILNEWTESQYYSYTGTQFLLNRRDLFEDTENAYNFPARSQLSQYWEPSDSSYLDYYRFQIALQELPGNLATIDYTTSFQAPAGSGEWLDSYICKLEAHADFVTQTHQEEQVQTACSVPNPYTVGQSVTCTGLNEHFNYLLQVFSADGRQVYARKFTGVEGWSIERSLPEGYYWVVVSRNNRPEWKKTVLIRH